MIYTHHSNKSKQFLFSSEVAGKLFFPFHSLHYISGRLWKRSTLFPSLCQSHFQYPWDSCYLVSPCSVLVPSHLAAKKDLHKRRNFFDWIVACTLSNHRNRSWVLSASMIFNILLLRISAQAALAAYSVWLQSIWMPFSMNSIPDILINMDGGFLKIKSMLSTATFMKFGRSNFTLTSAPWRKIFVFIYIWSIKVICVLGDFYLRNHKWQLVLFVPLFDTCQTLLEC